jgi:hypothetical protein
MEDSDVEALHRAYASAWAARQQGRIREALDILLPVLDGLESGDPHAALTKPMLLSADLFHRLEDLGEAHRRLDRALVVARNLWPSPSLHLAEAFCLAAVVEWNERCVQSAVTKYETGITEGERAAANQRWLGYHVRGLAELLLDTQHRPDMALAQATRAVALTEGAECSESMSVLLARFALGRAQLAVGMKLEAEQTFEALLEKRWRGRPEAEAGNDKLAVELKGWIAKARGEP